MYKRSCTKQPICETQNSERKRRKCPKAVVYVSFALKCAKLNVCVCGFPNIHYMKSGDQNGVAEWNL